MSSAFPLMTRSASTAASTVAAAARAWPGGASGLTYTVSAPGADATGDHPDATLLADVARCEALERQVQAILAGPDHVEAYRAQDAALSLLYREQAPLLDRICRTRAMTLEGCIARVRLLLLTEPDTAQLVAAPDNRIDDPDRRLMFALLRDLTPTGDA